MKKWCVKGDCSKGENTIGQSRLKIFLHNKSWSAYVACNVQINGWIPTLSYKKKNIFNTQKVDNIEKQKIDVSKVGQKGENTIGQSRLKKKKISY